MKFKNKFSCPRVYRDPSSRQAFLSSVLAKKDSQRGALSRASFTSGGFSRQENAPREARDRWRLAVSSPALWRGFRRGFGRAGCIRPVAWLAGEQKPGRENHEETSAHRPYANLPFFRSVRGRRNSPPRRFSGRRPIFGDHVNRARSIRSRDPEREQLRSRRRGGGMGRRLHSCRLPLRHPGRKLTIFRARKTPRRASPGRLANGAEGIAP